MKHLLLTATLAVTALGTVCGQAKSPAAAKPKYAGFYINDKLVEEISCYGMDEYKIVYPYFASLDNSDRYWIRVVAGSYDQAGKFVQEYSDNKSLYEDSGLEAIREKYAERGYGIVAKSNLIEDYNQHRATHPTSNYVVDLDNASVNVLKYTNLPENPKGSVIFYEIYTSKIKGYETKYDATYSRDVTTPIYQPGTLVYTSPKTKLTNRVLASTVSTKPEATAALAAPAKKVGKLGAALASRVGVGGAASDLVAGQAQSDTQTGPVVALLPEMQMENCDNKSKAVTIDQIMEVGRNQFGETLQ
jgi:hypothetical protein